MKNWKKLHTHSFNKAYNKIDALIVKAIEKQSALGMQSVANGYFVYEWTTSQQL